MLRRLDPALIAILLMATAFRLYRLDVPYVDAHSWRQVTNADIARLWTEHPINIFFPQVSWGGPDGYVGLEFPLIQALAAIFWRIVGFSEPLGRLVPAAFSVVSVYLMYLLGTRLMSRPVGRGAAFLLAFSPTYTYFGRTLLSDVPMMCFSIGAVLAYANYFFGPGRRRDAVLGAVCLALAGLVKIPAILILGPIGWMALMTRRWRVLDDPWIMSGILAALGAIGLWYFHADRIFLETGLTQAIFRPSSQYSGDIAAVSGPFLKVSHWTRWSDPDLAHQFLTVARRVWDLHLTPLGAIGTIVGFVAVWRARRTVVDIWLLAGLSLVLVSLPGQFFHEFHQLPLLAPLALYFGMGTAPLFDGAWLSRLIAAPVVRRIAAAALAIVWAGLAVESFAESPVRTILYRPHNLNLGLIDAGEAIQQATPPGSLLVTVEYDRYGSNSPMLLYYSRRRGWSFDATAIRPITIEYMRDKHGACYFATSHWSSIEAIEPDTAEYLLTLPEIPLPGVHHDYRLFSLCNGHR